MLPGLAKAYSELPVDGLKTGTSDSAGACFAATVNKDGHRLITIVLGAKHDSQEDLSRFVATTTILILLWLKGQLLKRPMLYRFTMVKI